MPIERGVANHQPVPDKVLKFGFKKKKRRGKRPNYIGIILNVHLLN